VIVVTDTSVILNLCLLGQESLLASLFGTVHAPPSVRSEFQRLATVDLRFIGLAFPSFIRVTPVTQPLPVVMQNQRLHAGEREALSLAVEMGAQAILMDERAGRFAAASLGLRCVGILGILLRAKATNLLPAIKPLLDQLHHQARFWIAPGLRQQILNAAGE